KGDKVLIVLNRDSKLITSIFGVIKAGGVFIIVSPDDPTQKINFIKDQTDARFLISFKVFIDKILSYSKDSSPHTYFENNFEGHGNGFCNKYSKSNGTFIFDINRLINGEDDRLPVVGLKSDDMLCIVYTSGSTGVPKGVLVTNRSLVNIFNSFDFEKWKFLLNFNQTFMPFMEFLLLSLYYGGTIVLANNEELFNPVHLFKNHSFDVLAMTPSRLEEYINNEEISSKLKDVKRIYLLGEKLRAILVEKLRKITHSEIYNLYGSSETGSTNIKLINDINTQNFGEISVGKPVFGVLERVLDIDDNPLPPLVIGELMVGGSISDGYWNDTKLTNAKFVEINAIPFFKTGDLAKYDEKGNYSIIGRLDNQIKLRGQRVDPGEIENNVPEDIGVEKAIVTVNDYRNDSQVLTLYFTTKSKSLMNDEIVKIKEMIKGHLVSVLPGFMVPQDYVYLEEFPKTSTGKVNVKDLKNHDDNIKEIIEPSNDLEQELFDICAEILGHTNFGVTNNLLNIGFTSLSLIRLSGKIFEGYHVQISSLDVIKNDYSISNIAKKIKVLKKVENVKNDVLEKYPLSPNLYSYYKNVVKPRTPESKSFNNPVCLDFSDFDVFKLKNSLLENIELNNYIKTSFIMEGGRIYQKRNDDLSVDIKIHEKELNDDIKKNFVKPFNIFEPPLFRLELYYHNGKVSLLFDIHHILIDRYSINMFFNDLIKLYFDKKIIKEYDYFDYSLEYSTIIIKKSAYSIKDSLKLFQLFLFNIFRIINVWHDRINHSSSKMQMEAIFFDEETVLNFCKKSDISADEFFLSLVTLALAKLFDMRKIKLSFVFNGRTDMKYSKTFGYFSYTVPLFLNVESFYKFNILKFFNHVKKMKNKAILDSIDLMKDPQQYLKEEYCHLKFLDTIQDKFKFLFKQSNINVLYNYIANMQFDTYSQLAEYDEIEIENINNLNENILHFTVSKTEDKFYLTVLYNSAYSVNEDDFVEYIESLFYKIIENPSKLNRL
ncbi:MAG: AMP-binding protein, partial [Methanobrevibacter sp.]|nr:AMP-binding protein [Candidatus Methanovirga australis]